MSQLRYPSGIDGSKDFIKFQFAEYVPPVGGNAYNSDVTPITNGDVIILNMPSDIGSAFNGKWGGKDTSGLAQVALSGLRGVKNIFDQNGKTAQSELEKQFKTGGGIANSMKNIGGAAIEDALKYVGNTIGQLPGLGANLSASDILQLSTGSIINPNTELLYSGQDLRTHGYSFKLIPQTRDEATQILKIVERFKKACLPSKNAPLFGGQFRNFIKVPEICQITFCGAGGGENPNLPKYKPSAFTSVSANYITDGQYISLRDGEPIGIILTVSMTELKLVYKEDITDNIAR